MKQEIDMQVLELLGPKTMEDMKKPAKVKVRLSLHPSRNCRVVRQRQLAIVKKFCKAKTHQILHDFKRKRSIS